jgi:hypothetical protein
MASQLGQSGIWMTLDVSRHVERMQPIDADQQNMLDLQSCVLRVGSEGAGNKKKRDAQNN